MGALQQVSSPELAVDVEKVLIGGDLSKLSPEQRVSYYNAVCRSLSLNPLTKPFAYLSLNGKLVLYALKDCTEQLRNQHSISLSIPSREVIEGVYVVTASATRPDGRSDEATGAVPIEGLKGESKANAMMKAETKAKRRVTLSICGLGMLDETEVESIPDARKVEDIDTGGHLVGTQAAANYVRDKKIEEGRAKQATQRVSGKDARSGPHEPPDGGTDGREAGIGKRDRSPRKQREIPRSKYAEPGCGGRAPSVTDDAALAGYLARVTSAETFEEVAAEFFDAIRAHKGLAYAEDAWRSAMKIHGDPGTVAADRVVEVAHNCVKYLHNRMESVIPKPAQSAMFDKTKAAAYAD